MHVHLVLHIKRSDSSSRVCRGKEARKVVALEE